MDIVSYSNSLDAARVLSAYRTGCFPMGYPGRSLVTWHRPDPRAILPLDHLHVPRSLERRMRKPDFKVTFDTAFPDVMSGCAQRESTWITTQFYRVYTQLFDMGRAHSVEVWVDNQLAAGLYGVHIGAAFFAESKFHHVTDMSKVALVSLARQLKKQGFHLLEVQYKTEHLSRFGVIEVQAKQYRQLLAEALSVDTAFL